MTLLRPVFVVSAVCLSLVSCAGLTNGGSSGTSNGTSSIDPNSCGSYTSTDIGRRLHAFLSAAARLEREVKASEAYIADTCAMMAKPLGVSQDNLGGDTKQSCNTVLASLRDHVRLGVKAEADFRVDYQPAVCTVDVDAAANAAAECEAKAQADIAVQCSGVCTGTCDGSCQGTCDGTCSGACSGSSKKGGSCNGNCGGTCQGSCSGTCQGSCSGGCEGYAEVDADASCQAHAEVRASVDAKCTEPKVKVDYQAGAVLDASKLTAAKKAMEAGFPRFLYASARISGPIRHAAVRSATTAGKLVGSSAQLVKSLGVQAACVAGQLQAAVKMMANVQASIDVQVEVSASATASAGGNAHASR